MVSREVREKIVNVFNGRIYCGGCGKRMRFVRPADKRRPKDEDHAIFVCGGFLDSGQRCCSRHSIRYPAVKRAVKEAIRTQMEYALSQEKLMRKMRGSTKEKNLLDSYTGKVNFLQQEQARIDARRAGLFENFAEGILDEEEYRFAKKRYDEEAVIVGEKLAAARNAKAELDAVLSFDNKWISAMHRAENEDVLSESLVKDLIRKVCVYEDNRIEVELNYGEDRALTERILAELEKGKAANE